MGSCSVVITMSGDTIMRKFVLVVVASLSLTLGMVGSASAAPSNFPTNPKACVGYSSTSANAAYQSEDPDKYRSDQARGESYLGLPAGERGRQDDVQNIRSGGQCGEDAPIEE